MKRLGAILVILIAVMAPVGVALASDITGAEYYGTIRVSNNGTAATNVATPITGINTTNLIDGGYLNATANNCAIQRSGSDVAFMPGWDTNTWMLYEPSIGANTYRNDIFYTSATDGKICYFPDSSGMSIPDDPSLEPSGNGTVSITAFIDTDNGSFKDIFTQDGALRLYVSSTVSGNITAGIYDGDGWHDPLSAGGWTNSINICDNSTATYANTVLPSGGWTGFITAVIPQIQATGVRYWYTSVTKDPETVDLDVYYNGVWNDQWTGAPGAEAAWNSEVFTANDVTGIRMRFQDTTDTGDGTLRLHALQIDGYYTEYAEASVTAANISSGEYDITTCVFAGDNETQTAATGLRYFSSAFGVAHGQRFNDLPETIITQLDVYLLRTGAATGTMHARVRQVSDNSILGTLGQIDVSTISLTGDNYSFNSTAIYNPFTQDIRVTLEYPGDSPPATFISTRYQNTDVYPFGQRTTSLDLTTWSEIADDLTFVLHYGDVLGLVIDGSLVDVTDTTAIDVSPNSASDWQIGSPATLYIETANITVNGVCQGSWGWEYGTTFSDLSGNGNTATPSFRTTSTDADVSAVLVDFQPVDESDAPAYTITSPTDWVSGNTTVTENFTTTITPTYPGSDIISDAATAGNTPVQLPTLIIASVFMLGLSYTSTHFLKKYNTLSLAVQLFIITIGLGILVAVHVIDNWMLWLFLMIGTAIAMMSTRIGFAGTGTTGNNLVGFLFMSFAGMTLINRILEGRFLQTADINIINDVLVFQPFSVFGWFTIPVPNVSFLTNGIPAIVRWDYSFFGGDAQIIQYMLYSITAVLSFILFVLALGAAYQMFSRGR